MGYESIPDSPGSILPGGNGDGGAGQQKLPEAGHADSPAGRDDAYLRNDAVDNVYAKDLYMNGSAAMQADVLGDLHLDGSAVFAADIDGSAHVRDSSVTMLQAEGPVDLQGGVAVLVSANEFTVRDGGSVLMTPREAGIFAAVLGAVLVAGIAGIVWLFARD